MLVSALELPVLSCVIGALFGLTRALFFFENRYLGFIPGMVCMTSLALGAVYSSIKLITAVSDFTDSS